MKKLDNTFMDSTNNGTNDIQYLKEEIRRLKNLAVQEIPLDFIDEGTNVRKEYDEESIRELAESIKEYDLLNPVQVEQTGSRFKLISGHRRFRAHQFLNRETIKAIITDSKNKNLKVMQLIENIQREELSPADLELAVNELHEEGLTYEAIAKILKKSKSWISTILSAKQIREDNQTILQEAGINDKVGSSVLGALSGLEKDEITEVLNNRISNNQPVTFAAVKEEKQRIKEKKGEKIQPDSLNIKITFKDGEYKVQIKETGKIKTKIKSTIMNCLQNIKELESQFASGIVIQDKKTVKTIKALFEDTGIETL